MEQTILVTGSTSGFGRLTVETLARQGYRVFAGMRAAAGKNAPAAEALRALAQREQLALHIVEIDVTDNASVERAIAAIIETTGRLDVVVNNAGVSYSGPLEALTESYRYELAPFGIDAAILEPGTFPTTISANRQVAADAERLALYQATMNAFTAPFYAENRSATPPDPQEVADAIAQVIAQPAGKRPLRTVVATVAQRQAPQALNDAATQAMHSFLEALHLPAAARAFQGEQEEVRKQ